MEEAPANRRIPWGTLLRAAAGIAIVVLVVTRVPLRDLGARLARFTVLDVLVLVLVAIAHMSLAAVRWWRLFGRVGERPSFSAVSRDLLVGCLFNTFLPTSFGGDVIRAIRASRRLAAGYHAWSTSIFERLVGMLTLAIVGALGAIFALGDALPPWQRIAAVIVTFLFALSLFFVAAPLRILVRVLEKRLPSRFIADIRGVITDLEGPLATAGARVETFAWSIAGFVVSIGFALAGAHALGASSHGVAIVVGMPVVGVLSMAPVSLGGHGLREGLFVVVLGLLAVPKDIALGVALLSLAYNIFFALLGGVVALVEPTPPIKAE